MDQLINETLPYEVTLARRATAIEDEVSVIIVQIWQIDWIEDTLGYSDIYMERFRVEQRLHIFP